MTDLHKTWHDNAERAFKVYNCEEFQFNYPRWRTVSRKIEICHNDAEWQRTGLPPSWIFKNKFLTATAPERPILHHYLRADR